MGRLPSFVVPLQHRHPLTSLLNKLSQQILVPYLPVVVTDKSQTPQVLPFVEAFFVLCDARTSHLPQPEPALLRAASSDLARVGSGATGAPSTAGLLTPAASGQLPQQQRAVLDAHLPFLRLGWRSSFCY